MRTVIALTAIFFVTTTLWGQQIPAGTLLPVMLDDNLASDKSKPGDEIAAKLMQDVPLPDGRKIKRGSKVQGRVISATPASSGHRARISVQFDRIDFDKQLVPVSVGLRALAAMQAVAKARQAVNANSGFGTDAWDLNLVQVGGQAVFTGQRIVKSQNGQVVGRVPEPGAVLAVPMPNPARGCPATSSNTSGQAFWVFSTDACGVYDIKGLTFVSGIGGGTPGQIVLKSPGKVVVRGGSGWLLQVN